MAFDTTTDAARPGLAVVPEFVVLPHFDQIERWSPGIVARQLAALSPGQTLIGIDEETALVSTEGGWRVEGARRVWIVHPDGSRTPHGMGDSITTGKIVTG